jgi:hypothetical protein
MLRFPPLYRAAETLVDGWYGLLRECVRTSNDSLSVNCDTILEGRGYCPYYADVIRHS